MAGAQNDCSLGTGVFYAPRDYIGLGRRVIISVVDTCVVWLIVTAAFALTAPWFYGNETPAILVATPLIWLYVAPLKRSRMGTLGMWLTGCKVVNLRGERPSLVALTLRSLLWLLPPFYAWSDLVWCGIDRDSQSLRDRYSNMYLVRRRAAPVGEGEVHLAFYTAAGYVLQYPRVKPVCLFAEVA